MSLAQLEKIIYFTAYHCIPHILQPLDMSVYKPLKNHFSSITDFTILASMTLSEKVLINKTNFHVVFQEAFNKMMTIRVPINFCKVIRENFGQNWGKITQHLVSTRPKKDFKTVCNEPPLASVMTQI